VNLLVFHVGGTLTTTNEVNAGMVARAFLEAFGISVNTCVLIVDRLVNRSPEIAVDGRKKRKGRALSHEDCDKILLRIGPPGCAVPAVTSIATGICRYVVAPRDDAYAETPSTIVEIATEKSGSSFLCSGQVVRGHGFDRVPRQDAFVAELTLV
jgi:hypothetical protein